MIPDPILALLWFFAIAMEIGLYVLLDGGDLGLGILSLLPQENKERSLIMHTIGPIWDANETWLVIAGGTLFGAFPTAYGIILNALYIPVMIMLFGFIFRAVSFEFHASSTGNHKQRWGTMFGIGSLVAAIGQGMAVGGLLSGIHISGYSFAGGPFDFLTPLTFLITVGILMSYTVVGYAYLIKKYGSQHEAVSFSYIVLAAVITFVTLLGATFLLPTQSYLFFTRWTTYPTNLILFADATVIGIASLALMYGALRRTFEPYLHALCMVIFLGALIGMGVGVFPYLIPPTLTIFSAAASRQTLTFMLYGLGPLIPIVLAYNFYLYRVFAKPAEESREEGY